MTNETTRAAQLLTEAQLLYRSTHLPDFTMLCDAINARLGATDRHVEIAAAPGRDAALLSNPAFHIMVIAQNRRLDRAVLADALGAAWLKQRDIDAESVVARHRAHIRLIVGPGPMPEDEEEDTGTSVPEASLDLQLRALKAAIDAIVESAPPLLVHWRQSEMLFTAEDYARAEPFDTPVLLGVRPEPFRHATTGEDSDLQPGVRAEGSAFFVGRTLAVDPAPRPIDVSIRLLQSMLAARDTGTLPLGHGDILDTPDGETLYIRHEAPDQRDPEGRIVLGLTPPAGPAPTFEAPATTEPDFPVQSIMSSEPAQDDTGISLTEPEDDPQLRIHHTVAADAAPGLAHRLAVPILILLVLLAVTQLIPDLIFGTVAEQVLMPDNPWGDSALVTIPEYDPDTN